MAPTVSPHAHAEVPQLPYAAGATPGCNTQHRLYGAHTLQHSAGTGTQRQVSQAKRKGCG